MVQPTDKTILVVDDEPNVRQYLRIILEDAGFSVITASDGEEALLLIKKNRPDFISLDLVMPRRSGHKLLYELRKNSALSRIPVLIVTAHAKDELGQSDLDDLLKNGVLSGPGTYLEKPVSPDTYVRAVRRALGLEGSEQGEEKSHLQEELAKRLSEASPEAMRRALEALDKSN